MSEWFWSYRCLENAAKHPSDVSNRSGFRGLRPEAWPFFKYSLCFSKNFFWHFFFSFFNNPNKYEFTQQKAKKQNCTYWCIVANIFWYRITFFILLVPYKSNALEQLQYFVLHNSGNILVEIVYTYLFFRLRLGLEKLHIIHPLHYMGKQMKQYRGSSRLQ